MTRFDLILLKKMTTFSVSLEFLHLGKVTSWNIVVPGHETNVLLIFKNPDVIAVSAETTKISKSKWLCSLCLSQGSNTKVRNMGFLSDPDLDFRSHVTYIATLNYIILHLWARVDSDCTFSICMSGQSFHKCWFMIPTVTISALQAPPHNWVTWWESNRSVGRRAS